MYDSEILSFSKPKKNAILSAEKRTLIFIFFNVFFLIISIRHLLSDKQKNGLKIGHLLLFLVNPLTLFCFLIRLDFPSDWFLSKVTVQDKNNKLVFFSTKKCSVVIKKSHYPFSLWPK